MSTLTRLNDRSVGAIVEQDSPTRWLALAGMIGPLLFALVVALLDIVQDKFLVLNGFDPLTESPVSVNALGPYGWIQCINFAIFGLLEIAFAIGLYRSVKGGRLAKITSVGFVFAIGVSMLLSTFPTDNFNAGQSGHAVLQTWHGAIHNFAFYMFLFSQILAYLFMWGRFRKDQRWRGFDWYSLAIGVLAVPIFAIPLPPVFSWFYVWILAFPLAWLELVAIRLWTLSATSLKVR
jgi:hypothetical protein